MYSTGLKSTRVVNLDCQADAITSTNAFRNYWGDADEPRRLLRDLLFLARRPVGVHAAMAGVVPHPELAGVVQDGAVEMRGEVVRSVAVGRAWREHRLAAHGGLAQIQADVLAQGQGYVVNGE